MPSMAPWTNIGGDHLHYLLQKVSDVLGLAATLVRGFVKCFLRVPHLLLQLPCCPGRQGELYGNCLQNLLSEQRPVPVL